ncbi:MAG: sulfite exporter TauE/SafE family protein [Myxococcota bacterium]
MELLSTVLLASFVGSLHCFGMCGGFVGFYAGAGRGTSAWLSHGAYNGGRLLTYVGLGALAGGLGATFEALPGLAHIERAAGLVAGVLIVAWGLLLLLQALGARWATLPGSYTLGRQVTRVLGRLADEPPLLRALLLGLSSTLLPCGWLYGFVTAAAGTGDPGRGAMVLFAFWLGTVPAMLFAGQGFSALAKRLGSRLGLLMPLLLIAMGLATLVGRGFSGGLHGG